MKVRTKNDIKICDQIIPKGTIGELTSISLMVRKIYPDLGLSFDGCSLVKFFDWDVSCIVHNSEIELLSEKKDV